MWLSRILVPACENVSAFSFRSWHSPFTMGLEWFCSNIDLKIVQTIVFAKHFNLEAIFKGVFLARRWFIKNVLKKKIFSEDNKIDLGSNFVIVTPPIGPFQTIPKFSCMAKVQPTLRISQIIAFVVGKRPTSRVLGIFTQMPALIESNAGLLRETVSLDQSIVKATVGG